MEIDQLPTSSHKSIVVALSNFYIVIMWFLMVVALNLTKKELSVTVLFPC